MGFYFFASPLAAATGTEPLLIVGATAGGSMTRAHSGAAKKRSFDTSIARTLVRLISRARFRESSRPEAQLVTLNTQRGHADAIHDYSQSRQEFRGRRSPGSEAPAWDGEVQRG